MRIGQDLGKSEARPENRKAKPTKNRHRTQDRDRRKVHQFGEKAAYDSRGQDKCVSNHSEAHRPPGRIITQTSGTKLRKEGTWFDCVRRNECKLRLETFCVFRPFRVVVQTAAREVRSARKIGAKDARNT